MKNVEINGHLLNLNPPLFLILAQSSTLLTTTISSVCDFKGTHRIFWGGSRQDFSV